MFQQGIDNSKLELDKAFELVMKDFNNQALQVELDSRLGTMLHWIMAYWERVKKSQQNIPEEIESFFSALSFANNQMKHEPTLTRFAQRTGGISFPISFPLAIPAIQFVWHLDSNESTKYVNQKMNFKKHLEGKEVLKTTTDAIEILKEYKLT